MPLAGTLCLLHKTSDEKKGPAHADKVTVVLLSRVQWERIRAAREPIATRRTGCWVSVAVARSWGKLPTAKSDLELENELV
jgi:hypothetical protein